MATLIPLLVSLLFPLSIHARDFLCADSDCLFSAVTEANLNGEANVILLDSGTYSLEGPTIFGLSISGPFPLTISGQSAYTTILSGPVFINSGAHLMLNDVAVCCSRFIGAIRNSGTLHLTDTKIENNSALSSGGSAGILNTGMATITNSTIRGNQSSEDGAGGIGNGGSMTIINSSITDNHVGGFVLFGPGGGGIVNGGPGSLQIINSTIAGNTVTNAAFGRGGGIFNGGDLHIVNSTIVDNRADSGGGIFNSGGSVQLENSILAFNAAQASGGIPPFVTGGPDCIGTVMSLGNNIITDATDCRIDLLPSDLIGDPALGKFVDDESPGGGHYPLLPGSLAIDAGNQQACPATDQLGQPRFGQCDIGAIEFQRETAVLTVAADVKPGDRHNNINPNSNARVSVALLSSGHFDAATVDRNSVRFGPHQSPADGPGQLKDVNHDQRRDLVIQVRVKGSGIQCGDTSVVISGQTVDGTPFQASDSINTVGCKPKSKKPS